MRTKAGFHLSRYYSKIRHGSMFNYDQIVENDKSADSTATTPIITHDAFGNIQTIYDAKRTPLLLGSIPSTQRHIDQMKKDISQSAQSGAVGIFTLNEPWECNTAGLALITKNNKTIEQFHYPSQDFSTPSFIDLIRAVRDLENRDSHNQQLSLVHCKAGRGRSATVIAAYLSHIIHKAKGITTPEQIEAYLVKRRAQVKLSKEQKECLAYFYNKLVEAGTFENLYEQHKKAVEKKDLATNRLFRKQ